MKPKIRFKGFEGEWKKTLVSDKCKIATGKSNTQDQVEDGLYPFYIRSEKVVRSNKYLYDCEAVLTIGDGNIGRVFHYVNGKFDLHQRCYKMTDFRGVNAKYFFYFFSTFFYDRAIKMSAKATVDSVRMEMIADMPLRYPNSKIEQQAIASYFTFLDSQISASTSRLASLKQMKAASLQAMFPQEGETVPKVRFKGFEWEWKKVKFSDLAERISTTEQSGILPGVEYEDIISGEGRLNKDVYQKECYKYGIVFNTGDILFGKLRPYLKNILLADFHGVAVGDFWVLRSKENNSNFLYTLVNSNSFMEVANISSGSKMPRADWNLVSATIFAVPSDEEEQKLIGNYFTTLDRQITLQTQRLEKLKQIKSACLDKMFV